VSAASTKARVLDAALASFGRRGYEATSLDAVAAASGVRKQTILYHFGGKEHLLEAVIDRSADELAEALERALRPSTRRAAGTATERRRARPPDGWDRVEAVVRSVFRLAARRPEVLGLVREVSRLGPPHADRLMKQLEPLVVRATTFLEAEMRAGALRSQDPRLVLMTAYSLVVGFATEVEVQRALGYAAGPRAAVRRRAELLDFLHSALVG
jgi:AcrR family transcriptional regulator